MCARVSFLQKSGPSAECTITDLCKSSASPALSFLLLLPLHNVSLNVEIMATDPHSSQKHTPHTHSGPLQGVITPVPVRCLLAALLAPIPSSPACPADLRLAAAAAVPPLPLLPPVLVQLRVPLPLSSDDATGSAGKAWCLLSSEACLRMIAQRACMSAGQGSCCGAPPAPPAPPASAAPHGKLPASACSQGPPTKLDATQGAQAAVGCCCP